MKVLHLISGLAKMAGGATEAVSRICMEQAKAGVSVTLVAFDYGELPDVLKQAISCGVNYVPMKMTLHQPLLPSWDMIRRLPKYVQEADILHVHGQWHFPDWWGPLLARKYRTPYVMMPHGALEPERLKISSRKKKLVGLLFDNGALRRSNGIFATAESEKAGVGQYGVPAPCYITPLGIDPEDFPAVSEADKAAILRKVGVPAGKKTLLYFSRITKFKGLDLLAKAWGELRNKFPDWHLVVAGPDDHHGYLAKAKTLFNDGSRDSSVSFPGPLFARDRVAILQACDCFVLPTRNENFSFAVAEAMICGRPVITTKGAPWAVLERVAAGKWVDVTSEAIKGALSDVFSLSDEARAEMGLRGKQYVYDELTWAKSARRMISVYDSILS